MPNQYPQEEKLIPFWVLLLFAIVVTAAFACYVNWPSNHHVHRAMDPKESTPSPTSSP